MPACSKIQHSSLARMRPSEAALGPHKSQLPQLQLDIAAERFKFMSHQLLCHGRWDRDPLARAVTKLVSNDKKETVASAPTLQKALTLMTDVKEAQHVHPNHIMIPLDSDTKNVLGAQLPSLLCPSLL